MTATEDGLRECPESLRADGKHGWVFDGDDPYILCDWCGERRDTLRGEIIPPRVAAATPRTLWPSPDDEEAVDLLARAMAAVVLPFVGVTVEMKAKEFRELMTADARHTLTLLRDRPSDPGGERP